ncbi:MAG: hypothetical protein AAF564_20240 [Bacteroidota bacterium]
MGQQQLLLLVAGIVIVGLAVMVGVQAFSENQKKANADALTFTAINIASSAQKWLQTPEILGGGKPADGNITGDFTGKSIIFQDLGYTINSNDEFQTVHGTFALTNSGSTVIVEGRSFSTSGGGDNNLICVTVTGLTETDISTISNPSSGSCS